MKKGIKWLLLPVVAALTVPAMAKSVESFNLVCGVGERVSQHYEYREGVFLFYTSTPQGSDNQIERAQDPVVTFEVSSANGYEFEEIKVRSSKFSSLAGEIGPGEGLMTVTFGVMTKNEEGNQRVVPKGWESVSVDILEALFDDDGYLAHVSQSKHQRDRCLLRSLK